MNNESTMPEEKKPDSARTVRARHSARVEARWYSAGLLVFWTLVGACTVGPYVKWDIHYAPLALLWFGVPPIAPFFIGAMHAGIRPTSFPTMAGVVVGCVFWGLELLAFVKGVRWLSQALLVYFLAAAALALVSIGDMMAH